MTNNTNYLTTTLVRNTSSTSITSVPSSGDEYDLFRWSSEMGESVSLSSNDYSSSDDSSSPTPPNNMSDLFLDETATATVTETETKTETKVNSNITNYTTKTFHSNSEPYDSSKLSNNNNSGSGTLIIFDWDDTLWCTSACQSGSKLNTESLHKFCLSVYETLLTMIRLYGSSNIYIVSNADKLWIQKCLNQLSNGYFINIYHLISLYNIQIISAKNQFSSTFPKDSTKWKQLAFEYLVNSKYKKSKNNKNINKFSVVSIGDSEHEYIASKRVIKRLNDDIIKNHSVIDQFKNKKILLHRVKLLPYPSIDQLVEQYELIKKIAYLFGSETAEIDIDYRREMKRYKKKQSK